jgi:TATA-box binding protein (TBP) (component of TFIID and TFIIIB)
MPISTPTKYKVSTITATGSINSLIDLQVFYQEADIVPYESDESGFIYIEFGIRKAETVFRGFNKKMITPKRKKKKSKRFDNQVTVILRTMLPGGTFAFVNVKVFKNGNVQMTGVKHIDQGQRVVDQVVEQVRRIHERGISVAATFDTIASSNYKVCLINSDFKMGLEIRRDRLNKIIQKEYNMYSSFEPCIYPGVKIQYCWNSDCGNGDGVCSCTCDCQGKGTGRGDGQCKKITIAVFQSGCIIITGAQSYGQIDDAYEFICKAVQKHKGDVQKIMP